MSREFLLDVLEKFAQVTSIIVETSKIKEDLDNNSRDDILKDILDRTKAQVENLYEHATSVKELFSKHQVEKSKEVNGNDSSSNDSNQNGATSDQNVKSENDSNSQTNKPLIKLVDIKKLVEPRTLIRKDLHRKNEESKKVTKPNANKTNLHSDETVVIITSSDEEVPKSMKVSKPVRTVTNSQPTTNRGRRKAAETTIMKTKKSLQVRTSSSDSSDSSEEEVIRVVSNRARNAARRKAAELEKAKLKEATSESSTESESDSSKTRSEKSRSKKIKKTEEESLQQKAWKDDPKFNLKSYVKVVRVPCEKLKEYYLEKLELLEINKLRDITSLKRKRRRSASVSSSNSGSKNQKRHKPEIEKKATEEKESESSGSEDLNPVASHESAASSPVNIEPASGNSKTVEDLAEDAMNMLDSDKEDEKENESDTPEEEPVKEKEAEKATKEDETPSEPSDEPGKEDTASDEPEKENETLSNKPEKEDETPSDELEKSVDNEAKEAENVPEKEETTQPVTESVSEEITDKDQEEDGEDKNTSEKEEDKHSEKEDDKQSEKEDDKQSEKEDDKQSEKEDDKQSEKGDDKQSEKEDDEQSEKKEKDNSKKSWRKDKLLTMRLSSSDSEEELEKFEKKKEKMKNKESSDDEPKLLMDKKKRSKKKRMKKAILSDSDSEKKDSSDGGETESSSSESEKEDEKDKETEKPKRKRVKRVHDSSEDDEEKSTRKQIRNIWGRDSLAETTKKAEAEEKERKARISEKQKKYNQVYESSSLKNANVEKVVLDIDEKTGKELLKVDDNLVCKLKPHQASGVQFMWDACFESLERAKTTVGSGCILAHCMGLGKTLQVITLAHTLLLHSEETKVRKVLVVSPLNTVLNWVNEFKQWLPDNEDYEVFELVSFKQNYERQYQVKTWHTHGGVLIIGYDMFRNLSNPENKKLSKKLRATFQEGLVDPGADLVICDEGHLLKNEKTNLSIAMNRIKTLRRIVLTGTPLQNNLKEYFCMVQFIKPNLLGTYKEYLNRFVNPITNGQYTDSTPHDIQIMRKRSHVLHKMLDGVVQRRDYSVLEPYLPPKFEYVLFLNLTETQIKLYRYYMDNFARRNTDGSNRTSFLFVDFQALQRICTHPRVLLDKSIEMKLAKEKLDDSEDESEGSLKDFINDDDDEEESSASSNSSSDDDDENKEKSKSAPRKRVTRAAAALAKENGEEEEQIDLSYDEPVAKEWWQEYCDGDELNVIHHSSKLFLLFEILKECEQIGDKVLVFSQSLYSLNVIEYFLGRIHDATQAGDTESVGGYSGSWCVGLDYFRLDGSSSCDNRNIWCKTFNDPANTRARLFLISTKAGGLGINLVAANRVVIFDVSWNPSHDVQSIYRVYRFGQTKPCYIYRFVTLGTMEMKVYERQVTKQAISKRVIDEQQIDRHYNQNDLAELYNFEPNPGERPTPLVPKDVLLGELLQKYENRVYKYHEHQSLLENKEEEGLNEEERKAAWEEFENEKKQRNTWGSNFVRANDMELALTSILRKENPTWTETQIRSMLPTLHAQMQEQIAMGDLTIYNRLQQEIQIMRALQAQRFKNQLYQQQMFRAMQQRQLGLAEALKFQGAPENWVEQYMSQFQAAGTSRTTPPVTNMNPVDVIDLND